MDLKAALKSQYHAGLAMLKEVIEQCPEDLWDAGEHPRIFWRIAYHALFYTHLYLQLDESTFRPWEKNRGNIIFLDKMPWPPHAMPPKEKPYTKEELLEYWRTCDAMIDEGVERMDLNAQECGFPWYHMKKLDHQMMNIRHLQQHVGQLTERIYDAGQDLDWVGSAP